MTTCFSPVKEVFYLLWSCVSTVKFQFVDVQPPELKELEEPIEECIAFDEGREA